MGQTQICYVNRLAYLHGVAPLTRRSYVLNYEKLSVRSLFCGNLWLLLTIKSATARWDKMNDKLQHLHSFIDYIISAQNSIIIYSLKK